ncbi:MAG: hypothetical protein HKM93_22605 [Desulfobacteraceae bacterium]|nr:hypothetical protein [Desulfobacteraceae bacterium]
MKQKYSMFKTDGTLVLKEFAELDKDIMSLLCEETYNIQDLETAISQGRDVLIQTLRTRNMYPPGIYVARIADSITALINDKDNSSADLDFDDKELFLKDTIVDVPEVEEDNEDDDGVEVDELLEPEIDDDFEEKKIIKTLKSSIKIADDDGGTADD